MKTEQEILREEAERNYWANKRAIEASLVKPGEVNKNDDVFLPGSITYEMKGNKCVCRQK